MLHAQQFSSLVWQSNRLHYSEHLKMRAKHQHVCKEMNQYKKKIVIFKLDSYFLFKLIGYFRWFTPIVHSMLKLRIHFRLVLIIYIGQSLDLLVSPLIYLDPKNKSSPIYLGLKNFLCNGINWASRNGEQRKMSMLYVET
jgi:hypothetical protein